MFWIFGQIAEILPQVLRIFIKTDLDSAVVSELTCAMVTIVADTFWVTLHSRFWKKFGRHITTNRDILACTTVGWGATPEKNTYRAGVLDGLHGGVEDR